ncbi:hypothetical protein Rrhod_3274 [Rhodococcus rhodnii LMG 5362]|uniref:Uncharacterized protein n=1 Tax=Rhodococcus rhodnii LMG 5362 TaxID=1273125 RepID=R7WJJ4_9NOCA|nr:hypothetical protein Rrhod_3274 [Rhodococcus rhodnii LMG 5362]
MRLGSSCRCRFDEPTYVICPVRWDASCRSAPRTAFCTPIGHPKGVQNAKRGAEPPAVTASAQER